MTDAVNSPFTSARYGTCSCSREDWLLIASGLCFECRKERKVKPSAALTLAPPAELTPASEAIASYISPDAQATVLNTDEDLQTATFIINDIKQHEARMEAIRTSVSQPLNQALRTYNSFFKGFQESAGAARRLWDDKIRAFAARREEARRAAEAALQEAIVAQDAHQATAAIQAIQPAPRATGLALVDAWDFEEFNHDIVPTSLTVLDRRLVMAEIKRQIAEGVPEPAIAGLKVFRRPVVKATG